MLAVIYRIYGLEDHRQAESFNPSRVLDFRTNANGYERNIIIKIGNFDKTGTHEYTELVVTAESEKKAYNEILAQISDGIFENCRVGKIEKIGIFQKAF